MDPITITAPDGSNWSVRAFPAADGHVALEIGFELSGEPLTLTLALERRDSRVLARGLYAAGGDAIERTFLGGSGR